MLFNYRSEHWTMLSKNQSSLMEKYTKIWWQICLFRLEHEHVISMHQSMGIHKSPSWWNQVVLIELSFDLESSPFPLI